MKQPIVWSIAGFDPLGMAGNSVDMETFKSFDVFPCSIITSINPNETGFNICSQYEKLLPEYLPKAIKIGMLGDLKSLTNLLTNFSGLVVLDPVINASSGSKLYSSSLENHLQNIISLLPMVDILTPNLLEAEALLNRQIISPLDIQVAAEELLHLGAKSVLIKGGHSNDNFFSQDYWANCEESFWLANQRSTPKNYRGTGCAISSAITACLALGFSSKDAIVIGKMYINRAIRRARDIIKPTAKLYHLGFPEDEIDMPYLSKAPLTKSPKPFPRFKTGLYPVIDGSHWLEKLLPQGVLCIQLRIKNAPISIVEEEIKRCVLLAKKYHATLFVNDYWELAIRYGADGAHLGQEDLETADITKIRQAGLYLGVSTHCYYEVARAHALNPSYIACGPIYPTTSKIMPFQPQGITRLKTWRRTLSYPIVAIGGINLQRLPDIVDANVDGISLISAITKAPHPKKETLKFLTKIKELQYK
ncbi:MAG: thiamine phosphate synthase [Legionellaceae bacterium]|nr:thiamine phosphate synthase [Legionellaceae bacterium]